MSDGCEMVDLKATLELEFNGCLDHGSMRMRSGSLNSGGADLPAVVDGTLSVLAESITQFIGDHPVVVDYLDIVADWAFQNQDEPASQLPERAKKRVVRELAHQILLDGISRYSYSRDLVSASMSIPFSPE